MKLKKKDIEEFIINFFLEKDGKSIVKKIHKVDFIEMGLLDSLDIVTLSFEIEKKFKIKTFPGTEQTLNNFKNLNKMVNHIYKKLNK